MASAYFAGTLSASIRTARSWVSRLGMKRLLCPFMPDPDARRKRLGVFADLVLRAGLEIFGRMAFMQLHMRLAEAAVDHPAALDSGAGVDLFGPGHDMLVALHIKKFARAIKPSKAQLPVPRPDRDIGDSIVITCDKGPFGQLPVEHVELALGFQRETVDGVLPFFGSICVEMAKAAAEIGRAAHLPHQPIDRFGARRALAGQERVELLGQMHQDRA